jgi:hypothetical protein
MELAARPPLPGHLCKTVRGPMGDSPKAVGVRLAVFTPRD